MAEFLSQTLSTITANLVDVVVYTAIAITFIMGLVKCVFPLRRSIHCLRRAVRTLDKLPPRDSMRPVWQNELFMGKKMQSAWRRFLLNAEQLDARGLTCDVRDYINDDTAIFAFGNIPLSEVIPGLLTSLGILGTFIGLMRGLGGLDVSDAAKTMESIPTMIGGMTFAFSTSIAGIACSLLFNLLCRMAQGGATHALDDFQEAFSEIVMAAPVDEGTQAILQREDQTAFLRGAVEEVGAKMADKLSDAMETSFVPITKAMNNFILGQTQAQMDGVAVITQRFIEQMNASLSGQFLQLGQTLSAVNRAQQTNYDAMAGALATADQVMENLSVMQQVTEGITQRFEGYVRTLSDSRAQEDAFVRHASDVVSSMSRTAVEQAHQLEALKGAQLDLRNALDDYALRSKKTMQLICDRANETGDSGALIAEQMKDSGKLLKDSYTSFVQNIATGLSKTMGMFDANMNALMNTMEKRVAQLSKGNDEQLVSMLSQLEQTLQGIEQALQNHQHKGA